jgi:hypothetical protein
MFSIEPIIASVITAMDTSSAENLDGFATDAAYAFEEVALFETVSIRRTERRDSVLEIAVIASETTPSLEAIAQALLEGWQHIAYQHFQATSVVAYEDATEMRFVTVAAGGGLCVTGRVTVTSRHYAQLIAAFERDFSFVHPIRRRQQSR